MPVSEPSGELWSKVKPLTEWPDTNEDMLGAMYFALLDSATAFAGLNEAGVEAVWEAWQDPAGGEFVSVLTWEISLGVGVAGQLVQLGGLAGAFAADVKNAKQYIQNIIALNTVPYEAAGVIPFIGDDAQERLVKQVATWINNHLNGLLDEIANRQNVDHRAIIAELGEGRTLLERGGDLLADNAELINKVSDVVGDISTTLGLAADATGVVKHPIAVAISETLGNASLGTGVVALGGHTLADKAGADVADETLNWDRQAVIFGAHNVPFGTTAVVGEQVLAEAASPDDGPPTYFNDLESYWVPREDWQKVTAGTGSALGILVVPFANAAGDGIAADNEGQGARDESRARDRVGAR
ncbi:hypothetical protein AB0I53_40220 [Saccharopolyspora sp. NPDC050389]|uniref:WXG100-like domain-containing protein n=1 Tax=Saccharopolyspora sp. NPDC050389 TaxID=3155516 RepID=UPI0033D87C03